jgi:hypothetical protein
MPRRTLACLTTTALTAALMGATPAAALVPTRAEPTWIANGRVWAIAQHQDTIYLGGGFTELSPPTGSGVVLDPGTAAHDPSIPTMLGVVRTVVPSPNGGWYVGGSFSRVNGQPRRGLAYFRPDGALGGWNPKPSGGAVQAMAVGTDGTLYVGGAFTGMKGVSRGGLAAFDAGRALLPWAPRASGGSIEALAVSADDSAVYAGGDFTAIGGTARARLAAIGAGGVGALVTGWNPGANAAVHALAVDGTTLYVGGDFGSLGGDARAHLAGVDANGTPTSWDPGANGSVRALAIGTDVVYAGGEFSAVGGSARARLAAIDTAGNATAWDPGVDGTVLSLACSPDGTRVIAGGDFLHAGATDVRRVMSVSTSDGAIDPSWAPNPNKTVRALSFSAGGIGVFAGGSFTGMGGVLRDRLGAIDATTGRAIAWDPGADDTVFALQVSGDGATIYAGGVFNHVGGSPRNRLAAIDAGGATVNAFNFSANNRVRSLALSSDRLYVGGEFSKVAGQSRTRLAAIRLSTNDLDPDWLPTADDIVRTMLVLNGRVYVGGDFKDLNDAGRERLAAVNAETGALVVAFLPGSTSTWPLYKTFQIDTDGARIFAAMGGGGGGRDRAYDAADGAFLWNAQADGDVQATAYLNGIVYVGGHFDKLGGQERPSLAAVNADTGALTAWNPRPNGSLWNLGASGSHLVGGGDLTTVGDDVHEGFMVFLDPTA